MPRYKLTLEYDGTPFCGWQRQEGQPSVQQALEEAAEKLCGAKVECVAAGRTDAGVHALGQVAHVDLPRHFDVYNVMQGLNHHLMPLPIAVVETTEATGDFHARFSATCRSYLYRILARRARPALLENRVWHVPVPLDAAAMQEAAKHLLGNHDFTSFRASECQSKSPVKTLDLLEIEELDEEIHIRAAARSFLHHQVRNMAGTLKLVGEGKWQPGDVQKALAARNRTAAGPTAPACGLYLMGVAYENSVTG